jgi:hypothetical protein
MRFKRFDQFFTSGGFLNDADVTLAMAGPSVSGGVQRRWFSLLADARYLAASSQGTREGVTNDGLTATLGPTSQEASFSLWELGVRAGPRVPIHSAALGGGIGFGAGALHAAPAANGNAQNRAYLHPFVWIGLDAKPLCEFAAGFAFEYGYAGATEASADDGRGQNTKYDVSPRQETTLNFHVAYEPNVMCTRRRAGEYRLNVEGSPGGAAPQAPVAATNGGAVLR